MTKATQKRPRLFLVDGTALAYRAYFALAQRPLINSRGMNTSAVFGYTQSLLRLVEKEAPDFLAVAFDSREPTFRHKIFEPYKATREKMPDDMADQLPFIDKVTRAMNIPFLTAPTFEADDIIGTLTRRAEADGCDVYIVSGDKDFMQLVGDHVFLYSSGKAQEPPTVSGITQVREKFGVPPEQVIDVLTLIGDSSDNVPGLPGVGPKTAGGLILEHGSVQGLIDAAKKGKLKSDNLTKRVIESEQQMLLSRELITIRLDLDIAWDRDQLRLQRWNNEALAALFRELEFRTLEAKALAGGGGAKAPAAKKAAASEETATQESLPGALPTVENPNYRLINTAPALAEYLEQLSKADTIAFDTETTGLEFFKSQLVGISLAHEAGKGVYVPVLLHPELLPPLRDFLARPKPLKGGHNVKFDLLILRQHGIEVAGIGFDSMLESYILDAAQRQHGLDLLSLRHLQIQKIPTEALIGKGKNAITMDQVPLPTITQYACEDVDCALRLHRLQFEKISKEKLEEVYEKLELPLLTVLFEMEYEGIHLDTEALNKLSSKLEERLHQLTQQIYEIAGSTFNIQSPKQLGEVLFEKLGLHKTMKIRVKKTKTGYSTDAAVLETLLPHPLAEALLEYRNIAKLKSTYTDILPQLIDPKTQKIHTSFNQTVAATGRLSSSDPNLQNIPIRTELGREIRRAFVACPPNGKDDQLLLSADYSQIELRVLAHLSGDRSLIDFFKRDLDIHTQTAQRLFKIEGEADLEQRKRAKAINFGILYGMGPQRLARDTGVSMEEAQAFIDAYFRSFPKVGEFIETTKEFARTTGYVETMLRRRRYIPEISSDNPRLKAEAERIAVNTPIQGSAADLIKLAMLKLVDRLRETGSGAKLLLQVHDELVLRVPRGELAAVSKLVQEAMEGAMELKVPLKVEMGSGRNWLEATQGEA